MKISRPHQCVYRTAGKTTWFAAKTDGSVDEARPFTKIIKECVICGSIKDFQSSIRSNELNLQSDDSPLEVMVRVELANPKGITTGEIVSLLFALSVTFTIACLAFRVLVY